MRRREPPPLPWTPSHLPKIWPPDRHFALSDNRVIFVNSLPIPRDAVVWVTFRDGHPTTAFVRFADGEEVTVPANSWVQATEVLGGPPIHIYIEATRCGG